MIKNILCAIDRSPSSLQAFGYAIALARWQHARLNLLEVIETAVPPGVSRAPKDDAVPYETRAALERDLRRVLTARRASDVKVESTRLLFSWAPGDATVKCTLLLRDDKSYSGDCTDDKGEKGTIVMRPPKP